MLKNKINYIKILQFLKEIIKTITIIKVIIMGIIVMVVIMEIAIITLIKEQINLKIKKIFQQILYLLQYL